MTLNLETIKSAAAAGQITWRYHAVLRFRERGITRGQVKRVLQEGHILEQHLTDKPFPKCLMMAMIEPDRPLYVSVAYNQTNDYVYIITVHWLDPSKWDDPWTRKLKRP